MPAVTWEPIVCLLCRDRSDSWQDLINHLRLMHPSVDREVAWPTPSDASRSSTPDQ